MASSKSLRQAGQGKVDLERLREEGAGKSIYWAHLPALSEAKFIYTVALLPALPLLFQETFPGNPRGCHGLTSPAPLPTVHWPRHGLMTWFLASAKGLGSLSPK